MLVMCQWRPLLWMCLMCAAVALPACRAPEPLPEQPWQGLAPALAAIERRHQRINTLSAECSLSLRREDGDNVTLNGVVILQRPDQLRAQAWKFDQKVIDLTVRSDGLWLWTSERMDEDGEQNFNQVPRADWMNALFELPDAEDARIVHRGNDTEPLTVRWRQERGTSTRAIQLAIDRPTLTVRTFDVLDQNGDPLHRITLDRYRVTDGIPLPTRIRAVNDQRSMTLRLSAIRLNESLPDGAFSPPADAERQR